MDGKENKPLDMACTFANQVRGHQRACGLKIEAKGFGKKRKRPKVPMLEGAQPCQAWLNLIKG